MNDQNRHNLAAYRIKVVWEMTVPVHGSATFTETLTLWAVSLPEAYARAFASLPEGSKEISSRLVDSRTPPTWGLRESDASSYLDDTTSIKPATRQAEDRLQANDQPNR